eukprot:gnl/TRDRNA2_/TRDRNA2_183975_c0_seq1.p1 gnl/TRDRNA2_/TRDRNA2_183975_c0~~gnl/TRDRNA2_/TRDRNA2_183975_c0_seq1.p1  ORF type:complete len:1121 (+),score=342.75 gnl/TRDRNA2_/TRDRNA2_183975_c0_seq1:53-3415(+)
MVIAAISRAGDAAAAPGKETDEEMCARGAAELFDCLDTQGTGAIDADQVMLVWHVLARQAEKLEASEIAAGFQKRTDPIGRKDWMALIEALQVIVGPRAFNRSISVAIGIASRQAGKPSPPRPVRARAPPPGRDAPAPIRPTFAEPTAAVPKATGPLPPVVPPPGGMDVSLPGGVDSVPYSAGQKPSIENFAPKPTCTGGLTKPSSLGLSRAIRDRSNRRRRPAAFTTTTELEGPLDDRYTYGMKSLGLTMPMMGRSGHMHLFTSGKSQSPSRQPGSLDTSMKEPPVEEPPKVEERSLEVKPTVDEEPLSPGGRLYAMRRSQFAYGADGKAHKEAQPSKEAQPKNDGPVALRPSAVPHIFRRKSSRRRVNYEEECVPASLEEAMAELGDDVTTFSYYAGRLNRDGSSRYSGNFDKSPTGEWSRLKPSEKDEPGGEAKTLLAAKGKTPTINLLPPGCVEAPISPEEQAAAEQAKAAEEAKAAAEEAEKALEELREKTAAAEKAASEEKKAAEEKAAAEKMAAAVEKEKRELQEKKIAEEKAAEVRQKKKAEEEQQMKKQVEEEKRKAKESQIAAEKAAAEAKAVREELARVETEKKAKEEAEAKAAEEAQAAAVAEEKAKEEAKEKAKEEAVKAAAAAAAAEQSQPMEEPPPDDAEIASRELVIESEESKEAAKRGAGGRRSSTDSNEDEDDGDPEKKGLIRRKSSMKGRPDFVEDFKNRLSGVNEEWAEMLAQADEKAASGASPRSPKGRSQSKSPTQDAAELDNLQFGGAKFARKNTAGLSSPTGAGGGQMKGGQMKGGGHDDDGAAERGRTSPLYEVNAQDNVRRVDSAHMHMHMPGKRSAGWLQGALLLEQKGMQEEQRKRELPEKLEKLPPIEMASSRPADVVQPFVPVMSRSFSHETTLPELNSPGMRRTWSAPGGKRQHRLDPLGEEEEAIVSNEDVRMRLRAERAECEQLAKTVQELEKRLEAANKKKKGYQEPSGPKLPKHNAMDRNLYLTSPLDTFEHVKSPNNQHPKRMGMHIMSNRTISPKQQRQRGSLQEPSNSTVLSTVASMEEKRLRTSSRLERSRNRQEAISMLENKGLSSWNLRMEEKCNRYQDMGAFNDVMWDSFFQWQADAP